MLKICITSAPPTEAEVEAAKRAVITCTRRNWLWFGPVIAALLPLMWLTKDSFGYAVLAGLALTIAVGCVMVPLFRSFFEHEGLQPVSPAQCVAIEHAMQDPDVARYVGAVQQQGRPLTQREVGEIKWYAKDLLTRIENFQAASAWLRVCGKKVEDTK